MGAIFPVSHSGDCTLNHEIPKGHWLIDRSTYRPNGLAHGKATVTPVRFGDL